MGDTIAHSFRFQLIIAASQEGEDRIQKTFGVRIEETVRVPDVVDEYRPIFFVKIRFRKTIIFEVMSIHTSVVDL